MTELNKVFSSDNFNVFWVSIVSICKSARSTRRQPERKIHVECLHGDGSALYQYIYNKILGVRLSNVVLLSN